MVAASVWNDEGYLSNLTKLIPGDNPDDVCGKACSQLDRIIAEIGDPSAHYRLDLVMPVTHQRRCH
jgi:hypothetical protein